MSKSIAILSFFLFCGTLHAQSDLVTVLQKMSDMVKPSVEVDKKTILQLLTWDEKTPWKAELKVETSDKNKKTTERYAFNLADFNPYLVSRQAKEKYQGVQCRTDRDRKYIGYWENNEKSGYEKEILLYFKDANAADEFATQFKAAIPLAQTGWNTSVQIPESLAEIKTYLASKVVTVADGKETTKQSLTFHKTVDDIAMMTTERSGSGAALTQTFQWSWGDLNPNAIELRSKGSQVMVEVETRRKLRFVETTENGVFDGFGNDITFMVNTPDDAKMLIKGLEKVIPIGEKSLQSRLPSIKTLEDGMQMLNAQLSPIKDKDETIEQVLSGDFNALLTRKETNGTDKSKSKEMLYSFYLGDIAANTVDLDISSKEATIEMNTAQNIRVIAVKTNNEQSNYEKKIRFTAPNIEAARIIQAILPQMIALAPPQSVTAETAAWLIPALADQPALKGKQVITLKQRDTPCSWTLTVLTLNEKKNQEEVWEFDLNRIDIPEIKFSVSGKEVDVIVPVRLKEKVIKYYKDGKQSFVSSIEIPIDSIGKAKTVVKTLQTMSEGCK